MQPKIAIPLLLAMAASLPSQRGIRTLTPALSAVSDAQLSPDGSRVAFRYTEGNKVGVGVVGTGTNPKPSKLYASTRFANFFWSPSNNGLYFAEGRDSSNSAELAFVDANNSSLRSIRKISGNEVRVLAMDAAGIWCYGTRRSVNDYSIFRVRTDGTTAPQDVVAAKGIYYDNVVVDRSGSKLAYTEQGSGLPHAPIEVRVADVDGQNQVGVSGGALPRSGANLFQPRNLCWLDAGQTLVFSAIDQTIFRGGIFRLAVGGNGDPVALTGGAQNFRLSCVSGDGRWIVAAATSKFGHEAPMLIPTTGGGRVMLEHAKPQVIAGAPSIDFLSTKVAFCGYEQVPNGSPQVQLIELDRELRVLPRCEVGANMSFSVPPLMKGERGIIFAGVDLLDPDTLSPRPEIQLPGMLGKISLDPIVLLPLVAGVGDGSNNPLSLQVTVPAVSGLSGTTIYLQTMRVDTTSSSTQGDFGRYVELYCF